MENHHESSDRQRVLLVSAPRTASNLLLKVLNIHNQPNVLTSEEGGYFFHKAFVVATREINQFKPFSEWTDAEKGQIRDAYQQCLDLIEEYSARAQADNKIMFAKEHAISFLNPAKTQGQPGDTTESSTSRLNFPATYGPELTFSPHNQTWLPDEYLRTWRLAFIIRHPALAFPSLYRALVKLTKLGALNEDGMKGAGMANMSLGWTRKLFDWSLEQSGGKTVPLVIDGNDVILNPGAVVRFCEAAGLDTGALQFDWTGESDKKKEPTPGTWAGVDEQAARVMLSTLEASKGIVKDKAPATVDIKAEADKWRAEFGDEAAGAIEKAVLDAMPDYEYLKERRVQG
ncbi:hypothetical protein C8A00DRAFT_47526 [Chaetomidium leptoderma]|uniref:Uncharacterized protein n=1 Tax=Chaetomidium leptoderma TaxID=669021 RepID=A0AAN6ZRX2_9PEZI|nr:hypothetical protein C8A00DRAFT_47526 [Chaetomidium leptoderma]